MKPFVPISLILLSIPPVTNAAEEEIPSAGRRSMEVAVVANSPTLPRSNDFANGVCPWPSMSRTEGVIHDAHRIVRW